MVFNNLKNSFDYIFYSSVFGFYDSSRIEILVIELSLSLKTQQLRARKHQITQDHIHKHYCRAQIIIVVFPG